MTQQVSRTAAHEFDGGEVRCTVALSSNQLTDDELNAVVGTAMQSVSRVIGSLAGLVACLVRADRNKGHAQPANVQAEYPITLSGDTEGTCSTVVVLTHWCEPETIDKVAAVAGGNTNDMVHNLVCGASVPLHDHMFADLGVKSLGDLLMDLIGSLFTDVDGEGFRLKNGVFKF